jgi:hypothetical protein
MNTAVYGPLYGTDSRGTIWQLWWGKYSYQNGLNYSFHSTIAAPFGNDVSSYPNGFLWLIIVKWLPILTNEILAYNLVLILSFILSYLFVYLATFTITRNCLAAFVSGLIFSLSPYHFQRSWEHFSLAQIQWVALFLFTLLQIYKKFNLKTLVLFILSATLILHMEFNYAYIVFVLTILFIIFIISDNLLRFFFVKKDNRKELSLELIKNIKFIGKIVFAGFAALLINLPFISVIFKAAFIVPKESSSLAEMGQRPFHYLFSQSARILDYFIPSSANPILGGLAKILEGSLFYGRGPIEQTLYLGWVAIFLSIFAWKNRRTYLNNDKRNNNDNFYIKLLVFIAFGSLIFSMPPYFNLGVCKIYFPSFLMYKILPMFRAYARFGLLSILSTSILAGIGLRYLLERKSLLKKKNAFASLFILLILFEFNNMPPFHVTDINKPPEVYNWLAEQKGDFIIAEYPLSEASVGETFIELDYLLYQRIHKKRLLDGAKPGTEADSIKQKLFKITDPGVSEVLKGLGVKYVILHLKRYKDGTNKRAVDVVGEIPDLSRTEALRLVKEFGEDVVYEVVASNNK